MLCTQFILLFAKFEPLLRFRYIDNIEVRKWDIKIF